MPGIVNTVGVGRTSNFRVVEVPDEPAGSVPFLTIPEIEESETYIVWWMRLRVTTSATVANRIVGFRNFAHTGLFQSYNVYEPSGQAASQTFDYCFTSLGAPPHVRGVTGNTWRYCPAPLLWMYHWTRLAITIQLFQATDTVTGFRAGIERWRDKNL